MPGRRKHAIVVDDDPLWRAQYVKNLQAFGFEVREFENEEGAVEYVNHARPHIAVVHFTEEIKRSLDCIRRLRDQDPTLSAIYATAYDGLRIQMQAWAMGAFKVFNKQAASPAGLKTLVDEAYAHTVQIRTLGTAGVEVFVLMPFAKRFSERYRLGIKEPIEALGLRCMRADERQGVGNIVDEVYRRIEAAKFIVADMTGRNPNVFYEVGYAHALQKITVLLTERADDIPFDLKPQRHIIYGRSIIRLREGLTAAINDLLLIEP